MEDESPNQINLDPESSESSDEDSLPRCHVCLEKRGGGDYALLHEDNAHAGFCQSCAYTLHKDKHECPICRGIIVSIMRVFQ